MMISDSAEKIRKNIEFGNIETVVALADVLAQTTPLADGEWRAATLALAEIGKDWLFEIFLSRFLALVPTHVPAQIEYCLLISKHEARHTEARFCAEKISIFELDDEEIFQLADVWCRLLRWSEAIKCYVYVIQKVPTNLTARCREYLLLIRTNQFNKARQRLSQLTKIAPTTINWHSTIIAFASRIPDKNVALAYTNSAISKFEVVKNGRVFRNILLVNIHLSERNSIQSILAAFQFSIMEDISLLSDLLADILPLKMSSVCLELAYRLTVLDPMNKQFERQFERIKSGNLGFLNPV